MTSYRKAGKSPLLTFFMPLDSQRHVIPGLNTGRIFLTDEDGAIGRWVVTSSYDGKQKFGDWNSRGGVIPPTHAMPGSRYWEFHTKRIIQPGQPVDDGFLVTFDGKVTYKTVDGATRSEIMVHDDTNRRTNPGSAGCIITKSTKEWEDFCKGIKESVSHLTKIPLFVAYSFEVG